jgi:hypothetical protein
VFGLQHVEPGKIKVCNIIECNPKRDELLNGNYSVLCVDVDTKRCPKVICVGFKTPLTLTIIGLFATSPTVNLLINHVSYL